MTIDLSVLEFGNINPPEIYAHNLLEEIFDYAQYLDAAGFKRFWMSEHYGPEFAWHSPEILLPLLAGYTEQIKIGQAGVLLNYHAPFRVAHNFSVLSALFPGRIDLGFVPAGIKEEAAYALAGKIDVSERTSFKERVGQLVNLLGGASLNSADSNSLRLPLQGTSVPDLWALGISDSSLPMAVKHQINFCISLFHVGAKYEHQKDTIKQFKANYFEAYNKVPRGVASVVCACREDRTALQKIEKKVAASVQKQGYIIGSPEECEAGLNKLAEEMQLDEIVLNIYGTTMQEKMKTVALIAEKVLKKKQITTAVAA